ncbi:MAG: SGNH/GDSL hydrolase family protein [Burkholderiales bacterium]|nr:SGNH/GDSL hydrolase family protein [Burkholderiales bacterium]
MKFRPFKFLLAAAGMVFATSASAVVALPSYSGLYVFGDSLSDSGNNSLFAANPAQVITGNSYVPTHTYGASPSGTYSNGPVWATQFASLLGLSALPSLLGGTNYAYGGATTSGSGLVPSLLAQNGSFLAANPSGVPSGALYVVAGGGNNARAAFASLVTQPNFGTIGSVSSVAASQYANDIGTIVDNLQAAGAQNIIVWNTPNLGLAPAVTAVPMTASGLTGSQLGSLVSGSLNGALNTRLASEPSSVKVFDLFNLVTLAGANGFTNTTDACGAPSNAGVCPGNIANALFWDGIHPTTAAHGFLAQQMFALAVPEPAEYAMLLVGLLVVASAAQRRKQVA